MNEPAPEESIRPEWLAAYVDGELDVDARVRVESWLTMHPEALAETMDQEDLSPANRCYWQAVRPTAPSREAWDAVFARIVQATLPTTPHSSRRVGSRRLVARLIVGGAVVCMFALVVLERLRSENRGPSDPVAALASDSRAENMNDADDEDHVFRVAKADDVELIQLPEAAAKLVVVGRHPMAGVPLLLASAGDVQVIRYGPDDRGNFPDIETTLGPDASMLWAPVKP